MLKHLRMLTEMLEKKVYKIDSFFAGMILPCTSEQVTRGWKSLP